MGKGGLNRLLLSPSDGTGTDTECTCYELRSDDARCVHIRSLLAKAPTFCLRVAVEPDTLHDAAMSTLLPDGAVQILVPHATIREAPALPAVGLIVAMQRPKVIGRVLEAASAVGVSVICIVAAEKVEKSYWDCKLFRDTNAKSDIKTDIDTNINNTYNDKQKCNANEVTSSTDLPGRPRGMYNHPHNDNTDVRKPSLTRVDHVHAVRRRLLEAVQQANTDARLPVVMLERRGVSAVLDAQHPFWTHVPSGATKVVAHPYPVHGARCAPISQAVASGTSRSAVLAIGPEGGWVDRELQLLGSASFIFSTLGHRVLRSETATIISLGLAHEGLRMHDG